jgi:pimeloyl-ACP methyl ester carboxylesterase
LLHGLGSCGEDWVLQRPALLPRFTVLAPDLRGQGASPMPAGWPTIEDLAGDVLLLLDRLEIRSAHVVGLSLGGAVALQLAADEPARLRSLVAVNTFARLRATRGSLRRGMERTWLAATGQMDELGRRVADGLFPDGRAGGVPRRAARLAGNRPLTYIKPLAAVSRFDLRSRLGEIRPDAGHRRRRRHHRAAGLQTGTGAHIPGARLASSRLTPATPLDAPPHFTAAARVPPIGRARAAFRTTPQGDDPMKWEGWFPVVVSIVVIILRR